MANAPTSGNTSPVTELTPSLNTDSEFESQAGSPANEDRVSELPTISYKDKTTDSNKPLLSGDKQRTLKRMSTLKRVATVHQNLLASQTNAYENVSKCRCGWWEIFLIIMVLCVIFCIGSVVCGIYYGNELKTLWEQYHPQYIDMWCHGHYEDAFTYKEGSQRNDWGRYFTMILSSGIICGAIFAAIIAYCCVYKPMFGGVGSYEAFALCVEYMLGFGFMFSILLAIYFYQCLLYYDRVIEYCDEGTMIYDDAMRVFEQEWLYYVIIGEFIKCGIMAFMIIFVPIVYCISANCTCCGKKKKKKKKQRATGDEEDDKTKKKSKKKSKPNKDQAARAIPISHASKPRIKSMGSGKHYGGVFCWFICARYI
eukprot:1158988_1